MPTKTPLIGINWRMSRNMSKAPGELPACCWATSSSYSMNAKMGRTIDFSRRSPVTILLKALPAEALPETLLLTVGSITLEHIRGYLATGASGFVIDSELYASGKFASHVYRVARYFAGTLSALGNDFHTHPPTDNHAIIVHRH